MMMFHNLQKKFEAEVERLQEAMERAEIERSMGFGEPSFWQLLVTSLILETGIARKKNGEVLWNEKGTVPLINWIEAGLKAWKILAYLVAMTGVKK